MANFEIAHKVTADCEGGYVNDKTILVVKRFLALLGICGKICPYGKL
ncbi:Uncharacterised protein [Helicobacter cinaedi]|uniref:Uncharacterized protein n=1 Tax=Helicobacter cinaedi TaxID=213 RepID=A0A377JSR3_9HELI|nr:hypothetical protein [Helicobacter cinaedi]STP11031.1 Uncharacterised protein [Helicobacter cinaedi]